MEYNSCSSDPELNDLLSDLSFRRWVLKSASEQNLFWENWLLQNPEKKEKVKQARIILKSLQFKESELSHQESSDLLKRIKDTNTSREECKSRETIVIPIHERTPNINKKNKKRKVPMGYLLRYAAILGGALVFAFSINLILKSFSYGTGTYLVEKKNDKGQKSIIYLPDGTVVNLNSSSKLIYPNRFEKDEREVFLEGEAFFEVTKSKKPFIVKTDQIITKVLGTSFNIKTTPDHEEHSVSLITGKVLVYPSKDITQQLILKPGEKGKMKGKRGILLKTKFDMDQEVGWKNGILLFREQPFKEAFTRIEDWYGVEFVLDHAPREDYLVTGRFVNEPLKNVLASIGFAMKFDHQIKGKKVYLNFKN